MPKVKDLPQVSEPAPSASLDMTNTCAITFYAAIWAVVAAFVAHFFFRY